MVTLLTIIGVVAAFIGILASATVWSVILVIPFIPIILVLGLLIGAIWGWWEDRH